MKMPSPGRLSDEQFCHLAWLARHDCSLSGKLYMRVHENPAKWQLKWFALYQNFLFYFENEDTAKLSGSIFLEHSTCERLCMTNLKDSENQNCFCVTVHAGENHTQAVTLRANTDKECDVWIHALQKSSFAVTQLEKEELQKKYIHVAQILESEKTARWQLLQQCEEQSEQIASLKAQIGVLQKSHDIVQKEDENEEIRAIKKVQSLIRGWLCRRRWHNIVQNYIHSPHAESMRKRNSLCFQLVESEEEYTDILAMLISCFYRPLKMAASSKKPPLSHEEVSSIFLNSETILFLHQIFLKGLQNRMESWPTLVLGDLFDMLLPMLSIYQEYVRNHHYSLQTLAECKQRPSFNRLLSLYEEKPVCSGRTLEWFLTCPMHRVPAYIITLHELLALTPHDHVERNALEYAQSILEDLSTVMHDEVSETENIRKNLSIERQIVEGCDMLLDVNQIFIRQGNLIQVTEKAKGKTFGGISLKSSSETRKESVRRCFLFSGYLLLTTRSSSGKLHLAKNGSVLPLSNTLLVEDCADEVDLEAAAIGRPGQEFECAELTFKLVVKTKDKSDVLPQTITLMAPSAHEKVAWTSDISQCIENLALAENADNVSISSKQSLASVRSDPRLFTDDHNIKYCKALNSCRLPKIRYASLERLLERLLDVRFLSIDFLNTFLITYRVFTHATVLLDTFVQFYYTRSTKDGSPLSDVFLPDSIKKERSVSLPTEALSFIPDRRLGTSLGSAQNGKRRSPQSISITVSHEKMANNFHHISEDEQAVQESQRLPDRLCPNLYQSYRRHSSPSALGETTGFEFPVNSPDTVETPTDEVSDIIETTKDPRRGHSSPTLLRGCFPRARAQSTSYQMEQVSQGSVVSPSEVSFLSSSPDELGPCDVFQLESPPRRRPRRRTASVGAVPVTCPVIADTLDQEISVSRGYLSSLKAPPNTPLKGITFASAVEQQSTIDKAKKKMQGAVDAGHFSPTPPKSPLQRRRASAADVKDSGSHGQNNAVFDDSDLFRHSRNIRRPSSPCRLHRTVKDVEERGSGVSQPRIPNSPKLTVRIPRSTSPTSSPRSPLSPSTNAGVVVTSSRPSRRRSSISSAAAAFAAATAGASPSPNINMNSQKFRFGHTVRHVLSNDTHLATMRVLTIIRHWVTKHPEDFKGDFQLKEHLIVFMEEILNYEGSTNLEQKFANAILRTLERKQEAVATAFNFEAVLCSEPAEVDPLSFEKFSATQLAEQLTLIEHLVFARIPSHEFLNLAWMKPDKKERAPNILQVTQRFNEMSRLVATEILKRQSPTARATVIEKWSSVAEVCRNLNNFNSVLEITSAFSSSAIYRLKKTWEKVSKQTRTLIDKLQKVVSAEGRFKNLRCALRCADPPCIPYLGYNLTDLAFIEDGTTDCNEDGLINFSKMRMIAEVVQEIRHYQQTTYSIEYREKVARYLLCTELLMDEEQLYGTSLLLEPRKRTSSRVKQPLETEI